MADTKVFMADKKYLDIIIQMALREIDPEVLATALVQQDEPTRQLVLRNMSPKAAACLQEEIRARSDATPESVQAGLSVFVTLLENAAKDHARIPLGSDLL